MAHCQEIKSRVGRSRERQYQQAAQKRNEAFLKYSSNKQTARYFERECGIARHYDSWNYRDLDPNKLLEKAKKEERLAARRSRLAELFCKEEETYRKELYELTFKNKQREVLTLEALREKLKEKRAEQDLYYPRTCRKHQSYLLRQKNSIDSVWNSGCDSNQQISPRICRDSTNLFQQNNGTDSQGLLGRNIMSNSHSLTGHKNIERQSAGLRTQPPVGVDHSSNSKYSERYSRRSLENTNVRTVESEYVPSRSFEKLSVTSHSSSPILYVGEVSNQTDYGHQIRQKERPHSTGNTLINKREIMADENTKHFETHENPGRLHLSDEADHTAHSEMAATELERKTSSPESHVDNEASMESPSSLDAERDEADCARNIRDKSALKITDHRQFESERSMPWLRMDPHDKNLSEQMFLYLTHRELMQQIEDLTKRESHACTKQSWDEALRLRDMRNRLELIREKRLFNMDSLQMDDEIRAMGLANIEKRARELSLRENACTNSNMYSEEAKELWKQWVHEDEHSVMKEARVQRDNVMKILEAEWQNLAVIDKDKISQSFHTIMNQSSLQDELNFITKVGYGKTKSVLHSST